MSTHQSIWPVSGYENSPIRKRMAFFRPWIEDKKVCAYGANTDESAYIKDLAAQIVDADEADFVLMATGEDWNQAMTWPFEMSPKAHLATNAASELNHARIGIAIPTYTHARAAIEAASTMIAEYPGYVRFVIVANGVDDESLERLNQAAALSKGAISILPLKENRGYGPGCNAGLQELAKDESLHFFGVMNDDVLPGTDCLYEMVRAFQELESMGHNPGVIGPVSNEVNGPQRVDIGAFGDAAEMVDQAHAYWKSHRSAANQTLQLRGLLMLMNRKCLETVGGFDPRFGIGNFEDDDHNLRARLAGFTLWIATGAFLFHHGSSTFRAMQVDYEANIQRNMEAMMRKWGLAKLEDWISLDEPPAGVSLFQALDDHTAESHRIRINGEPIDLIHQASDVEFAAWIMNQPSVQTASGREALIKLLTKPAKKAA